MRVEQWQAFVRDVCLTVDKHDGVIHTRAWGLGEWEGFKEESFMVNFSGGDLFAIREALAVLAFTYDQAAIALIVGDCIMVAA